MLDFIKSIFTGEKAANCQLYIQNVSVGDAIAKYSGNEVHLSGKFEPIVIKLKDLKDLKLIEELKELEEVGLKIKNISKGKLATKAISFTVNDKKYVLISSEASEIYTAIHPLVYSSYLFEAFDLSYLVYNGLTRSFEPYGRPVILRLYEDVLYYLRIEDQKSIIHFEKISTNTQYYMDDINLSFVWSVYSDCKFYTFCLRFKDSVVFTKFKKTYVELCYRSIETTEEGGYHQSIYEGIGNYVEKEEDEENLLSSEEADDGLAKEDEISNSFMKLRDDKETDKITDITNKLLVMGNSQCFLSRGTSLGVFDLNSDDVKFRTQIRDAFEDPVKIITHNGDSNLLVLDKNDEKHLGLMDLARGEIVEKWDMGTNINDYFDSGRERNDSTLVGLSDYSLFRIDPRTAEKVVAKKEYKCKNEFSCGASTENGGVAVASRKGDLRLYDKIDKRAKTLLPGFGDAILGVDTSKDGSLVLCTYRSYLLLFQVNSNYSKNSKESVPIRLQLKPQHLAIFSEEISFSPGKFDLEDSIIITSTGKHVLEWKVEDVLSRNVYKYTVKSLGEHVVDEDFIIDGRDVVVATRNNIRKIHEKEMKRK